jgi:hypothetical protein
MRQALMFGKLEPSHRPLHDWLDNDFAKEQHIQAIEMRRVCHQGGHHEQIKTPRGHTLA